MEPLFELTPAVSADDPVPDTASHGWSTRLTHAIAHQVRRWRRTRGLSAQQLSDRTRQLGHHLPRSVIANLEVGRRDTVSVAELLVLAAALNVPPVMLIAAVGHEAYVEVLPGVEETAWRARGWILGALAPNYSTFSPRSWQEGRRAIELYDVHRLLVNECQQTLRRIRRLAGDRELDVTDFPLLEGTAKLQHTTLVDVAAELSYGLDQLRTHRRHIQSEGFLLPEMPSVLAAMLRESDSRGRHHRQESAIDIGDDGQGQREEEAQAIIFDIVRAMFGEPMSETDEPK